MSQLPTSWKNGDFVSRGVTPFFGPLRVPDILHQGAPSPPAAHSPSPQPVIHGLSDYPASGYPVLQLRQYSRPPAAAPRQMGDKPRGCAMDEIPYPDFFLHPTQVLHRQYEAVRAVFVEHRPLPEVAQHFGYSYGGLRNLVADFRARCRTGQAPPFSPNRAAVAHPSRSPGQRPLNRKLPLSPTAASSPSPRDAACAAAWPGSSCSCPSWRDCTSAPW